MRFLVDAQLPPALARMLSDQGHTDEDLPEMAAVRATAPTIVWVRHGNTTRRALLEWIEPLIARIVEMAEAGHRIIELR